MSLKNQSGLTLIELMVVVALIGLLLGMAIPTYQSYQTSVRMSKTSAHFDEAVRLASTVYAKEQFEMSTGRPSSRPQSDAGWVKLFNTNGGQAAFGGGPAFMASATGDSATGAIGVTTTDDGVALILVRPEFYNMIPVQARIDMYDIVFTNL